MPISNITNTETSLFQESQLIVLNRAEESFRLSMIVSFYPRIFGTQNSCDFAGINVEAFKVRGLSFKKPNLDQLKQKYGDISAHLSQSYPNALYKTSAEHLLSQKFLNMSKRMTLRSVWIGNKNIDFFFPNCAGRLSNGGRRFSGLAIEVDGPIHDYYPKLLKDNAKEDLLFILGITLIRVRNEDLNKKNSLDQYNAIINSQPIDTRARRRMWMRIFLTTIVLTSTDEEIEKIFSCRIGQIRKRYDRNLTGVFRCI